jgi:hypothetical protein
MKVTIVGLTESPKGEQYNKKLKYISHTILHTRDQTLQLKLRRHKTPSTHDSDGLKVIYEFGQFDIASLDFQSARRSSLETYVKIHSADTESYMLHGWDRYDTSFLIAVQNSLLDSLPEPSMSSTCLN